MDQDLQYEKSWLLSKILDTHLGTVDQIGIRRRFENVRNCIYEGDNKLQPLTLGSLGEGLRVKGPEVDITYVDTTAIAMYPEDYPNVARDTSITTVLFMTESNCPPGYVALEVAHLGHGHSARFQNAVVPLWNSLFISSDIFRSYYFSMDSTVALQSISWPKEASEWSSRFCTYGWPSKTLKNKIIREGCHLIPIGNTPLQWRISFSTAERQLVHSLSHAQFKVYGLLKYFAKDVQRKLHDVGQDASGTISSYLIKTLVFYAVENSPMSLWQERYTFICFWYCFNMLIDWIRVGYCPHYFISTCNLFRGDTGKIHLKLLHVLLDIQKMKWMCLSAGNIFHPAITRLLGDAGQLKKASITSVFKSPSEADIDTNVYQQAFELGSLTKTSSQPFFYLLKSQSEADEFTTYYLAVKALSNVGVKHFPGHCTSRGNKEQYRTLKKCRWLITPNAETCKSPGCLTLATFFYLTGNYGKTLCLCREIIAPYTIFFGPESTVKTKGRYEQVCCGRGYTLFKKFSGFCASYMTFEAYSMDFCLPQLHLEMKYGRLDLCIPPMPYALFLSFLCYHELGDFKRRDEELLNLLSASYDEEQGGGKYWIVHTLLGICYQTVGDNERAIKAYEDSLRVQPARNPAIERVIGLKASTVSHS